MFAGVPTAWAVAALFPIQPPAPEYSVAMEMDQLVALCKRRGFLFQSSEIYGGLNGFWDYGPMGVELKRNVREAWWRDMVTAHNELIVPPGARRPTKWSAWTARIIMHPQVWKCSGHYDLFHDYMVDCRESKRRYRHDQVYGRWVEARGQAVLRRDPERWATRACEETRTERARSSSAFGRRTPTS